MANFRIVLKLFDDSPPGGNKFESVYQCQIEGIPAERLKEIVQFRTKELLEDFKRYRGG